VSDTAQSLRLPGLPARWGRPRRALGLLASFSATLFLVPVAVNVYEVRYAVPGAVMLLIAGARGAEVLAERVRDRNEIMRQRVSV
jgi:hypothetical protein